MRHIALAIMGLIALSPCYGLAEDAAELEVKGAVALKLSQTQSDAIISAAISYGKAAAVYEQSGNDAKATEMNSFLYWCKKKMTLKQMDGFLAQHDADTAIVAKRFKELEKLTPATEAQTYFDRAEAYAKANTDEHLFIAIRFFEVADRFKGTDASLRAQDRSLKEMMLSQATITNTKPIEDSKPAAPADATHKLAVPAPEQIKETEKLVREIVKGGNENLKPSAKLPTAQKLLDQAVDPKASPVEIYVEAIAARDLACAAGDVPLALRANEVLEAHFDIDAFAEKIVVIQKMINAVRNKDQAGPVAEYALNLLEELIKTARFDKFNLLRSAASQAATNAQNVALSEWVKERISFASELQPAWTSAQQAFETLKNSPADPAENLTAGMFLCIRKYDFKNGLPLLAKGSNTVLKQLAERDLANPDDSTAQMSLGDGWWEYAEKDVKHFSALKQRAAYWYGLALPNLTALKKVKVEQRLSGIPKDMSELPPLSAFADGRVNNPQWISKTATYTISSDNGTYEPSPKLLDGSGRAHFSNAQDAFSFITSESDKEPHIIVDLGSPHAVTGLEVLNRDGNGMDRAKTLTIWIGAQKDGPFTELWRAPKLQLKWTIALGRYAIGRYVKLGLREQAPFHLNVVKIFGD